MKKKIWETSGKVWNVHLVSFVKKFNAFPFILSRSHSFQERSRKRSLESRNVPAIFQKLGKRNGLLCRGSQWAIVMRIQNGLTWPGCSLLLTLHFSEKRSRLCKLSSRATARRYDETIPYTPFNFWDHERRFMSPSMYECYSFFFFCNQSFIIGIDIIFNGNYNYCYNRKDPFARRRKQNF